MPALLAETIVAAGFNLNKSAFENVEYVSDEPALPGEEDLKDKLNRN